MPINLKMLSREWREGMTRQIQNLQNRKARNKKMAGLNSNLAQSEFLRIKVLCRQSHYL